MQLAVAIDWTDKDAAAVKAASKFGESAGATLVLINVFSPWVDMGHATAPTLEEQRAQVTAERDTYLRELAAGIAGVPVRTIVEQRHRTEETDACIARVAAELGADILVVASKRASGVRGLILGSTAQGLLRLSPCPVLVVRPE
jgi:nucleotide-binding universal stress UspA family protein